jgi:hypothetical protein
VVERWRFWEGVAIGLLLALAFVILVELIQSYLDVSQRTVRDSPYLILIAALIPASLAALYARKQLEQQEEHRAEALYRANRAKRALLPPTLSELQSYVRHSLTWYLTERSIKPVQPRDLASHIAVLSSAIETVDLNERATAEALMSVARQIQIVSTRIRDHLDNPPWAPNTPLDRFEIHTAVRFVLLYSSIEKIFPYARGNSEVIDDFTEDFEGLCSRLGFIVGNLNYSNRAISDVTSGFREFTGNEAKVDLSKIGLRSEEEKT